MKIDYDISKPPQNCEKCGAKFHGVWYTINAKILCDICFAKEYNESLVKRCPHCGGEI